jgi:putative nucleotidyltransferase with HDIG domain
MATPQSILIVDEDHTDRNSMGHTLSAAGYAVTLLDNSADAMRLIADGNTFDLVLSDFTLGKSDGMLMLEFMHSEHSDMPVVIVTAVNDLSMAMAAIRRGAYDYLMKPFVSEQLINSVNRALGYRRLALENSHHRQELEHLVEARTDMLRKAVIDLERSYDITLEALGDALDLRDAETEGHSKRVTAYTLALARAAGVSAQQRRIIARGAFLHDIGKIAIPDSILLKPGKLNADEMSIMREHCNIGYHMLRKIPYLCEASEIVYSHQERFDGLGYPRGLSGDAIPLGSRMFAIADTMDAMTSDRPYRAAQTFEAARAEIIRCSGTQFDPAIVQLFERVPDPLWRDLRAEITEHAKQFSALRCSITVGADAA